MNIDVHDLLTLSEIPGIGPNRLRLLVSHFKDTRAVSEASAKELIAVEGIERKTALSVVNFYRDSGAALAKRHVDVQLNLSFRNRILREGCLKRRERSTGLG